jgi:preprotein translocase subunit YajC
MKENDKLPHIIAGIALVLYLVFLFFMTRPQELQGGNIERAIQTEQYR